MSFFSSFLAVVSSSVIRVVMSLVKPNPRNNGEGGRARTEKRGRGRGAGDGGSYDSYALKETGISQEL